MGGKADSGTESFGAILRGSRGKRGLTQEELAERAGLHVQTISQLELGVIRRPRSTTVQFLADALKLGEQERVAFIAAARAGHGPDVAADPTSASVSAPDPAANLIDAEALLAALPSEVLPDRAALPSGSRMPLAPNPLFVGRAAELLQVAAALRGGGTTVALGHVVASTGLGGLGKTQLAVELVHRYGRFFAGGVFWLSFASADEIPLQIAACAGPAAMDLTPGIESQPLEERVQRVQRAWQSAVPRLLVFDNCEDETLLEAWRPPSGGGRVLVTSRRSNWSPTLGVTALPLDLLPHTDSIELLRRYRPDLAPDDPSLNALAAELGDLPLALHLAGSYLRAYRSEISLDNYLIELTQADVVQHASLLGAGLDDSPSPTHHVQSVAKTFAFCLERLDREGEVDRVAIALLARMACMAPGEPVPRDLLAKTMADVEPRLRADGLRRLGSVGLVEEGDGWLRLHRLLVHFVRQEGLDPEARPSVARTLIGFGKDAGQRHLRGQALTAVIPHLVDMAGAAERGTGDGRFAAELCFATGQALQFAISPWPARPQPELVTSWYERARALLEPAGPSEDLALVYINLALGAVGALDGGRAVERAERAIAIATEAGADAPRIWAYNYLGLGHVQLGQLAEGLEAVDRCHREAVAAGLDVIAANALYNGILIRLQHVRPLEALERIETLKAMQADSMAQLRALRAEGMVHLWGLGRPALALAAYEEALALARDGEAAYYANWLRVQLAVAHIHLDHLDVARELLPDRSVSREGQDRVDELWAEMRLALDSGQADAAVPGAEEVLRGSDWPLRAYLFLSDVAVEALLAMRRAADAGALVERMVAAGADPTHPLLLRMRGRTAASAADLRQAADAFRAAGVRHEEARSRLALARVLVEEGSIETARSELCGTLESAEGRGAVLEARMARAMLAGLGSHPLSNIDALSVD